MRNVLRQLSNLRAAFATALAVATLCILSAGSASAQIQLSGHMAPEVQNGTATLLGHYDPTQKLRLAVVLALPDPAGEKQFLSDVYDKNSPLFHQFLSQEEWRDRFAPTVESEQAVVDWAQSEGFTVTHRYNNRLVVDLEAPSGTIEQALSVTINSYQLPAAHGEEARTVFSNDREPSVPVKLHGVVDTVLGLNSIVAMRPSGGSGHLVPQPDYSPGPVVRVADSLQKDARSGSAALPAEAANTTNGTTTPNGYDPQYFWNSDAYDYQALMNQGHCCNPLNNSSGHSPRESSIAVASFADVSLNDIDAFQAYFSNLAFDVDKITIDGTYTCANNDDGCSEVTMDTEWSLATANSQGSSADTAKVVVYEGANYINSTIMDLYTQMEDDAHARTMTTSWGVQENIQFSNNMDTYNSTMQSIDKIFSSMSGEGWTLVAASGDQGATGGCTKALAVQFPSSDPNVTGVGGTELNESNPYEVAWTGATYLANPNANPPTNDACDNNQGGSTGGFSEYFPAPSFQSGMGFSKRAVPDLSLDTTHGHDVYFQGSWIHPGGTSVAAPMLAGFFAQANAYLLSIGSICGSAGKSACAPIGNANYPIYWEGKTPNAGHYPFYDITQGCNSNDITVNDPSLHPYCAGPGYDEVTGWGTANMLQLAWAINWELIPATGESYITWSGPARNKWYNTNQTVNWKVNDYEPSGSTPASGIAGETQGWDSLPSDPYTEPHGGSGNSFYAGPQFPNSSTGCLAFEPNGCSGGVAQGCHTAYARGWNNQGFNTSGNSSYPESYGPICYDTVAPTASATRSLAVPSSGWYTTPVKITLTATDPGGNNASGIARTFYTAGGATCSTTSTAGCIVYGSPFTVSAQGYNIFAYFTEDNAGNFSTPSLLGVNIDETAPSTTIGLSGAFVSNSWQSAVTVVLTSTDSLSGVKQTTYTLDGGASTVYTGSFKVSTPGSHKITFTSIDIAGNVEATQSDTFVIESPTTTTFTASPTTSTPGTTVTLKATLAATLGGTPTGSIVFHNGTTVLGTVALTGNSASFTTTKLPVGNNVLYAVYGGATYYVSSTSVPVTASVTSPTTTTLTSSANPAKYGAAVTFNATVKATAGPTPTGTVTFKDGTATIGTASLNTSGVASFTSTSLAVKAHTITAVYAGNGADLTSTSAVLTETVSAAITTTTLTTDLNPAHLGYTVLLNATVKAATGSTPTGNIAFKDGATTLATLPVSASGIATYAPSNLAVGSHSITAVYTGDTDDATSTSAVLTQKITTAVTTTTVTSSLNPAPFGSTVKFTAKVAAGSGPVPTGTVTFKNGATVLGTATLASGSGSFSVATLTPGTHSITAVFTTDTDDSTSTSAALSQSITAATTTTTLKTSASSAKFGVAVTFTATVKATTGTVPTGTVTFKDGTTTLGSATLTTGVATFTTSKLAVEAHSITAVYKADTDDATSTSAALPETITAASTTTTLASSLNPAPFGTAVKFTATVVAATASTPTGTVTFKSGTAILGTATLGSTGTASFSTTTLAAGKDSITAVYTADTDDATSTSAALAQTITAAATTTTLTSSLNPATHGTAVKFTATVKAATGPTPTGTVTFKDGTTTLGTGTLTSGVATFSTTTLTSATHTITAVYAATSDDATSTSAALTETVHE